MPSYSIKLVPLRPDGCARVTIRIKTDSRTEAQRAALRSMKTCRLHDDEPRLLPAAEDARVAKDGAA